MTGGCDNPTRWYDSDGVTFLQAGDDVQLFWVGPDGIQDGIDTATCQPAGDDEAVTDNGATRLDTIDVYHDGFVNDGVVA